jgi:hypothetical protein
MYCNRDKQIFLNSSILEEKVSQNSKQQKNIQLYVVQGHNVN